MRWDLRLSSATNQDRSTIDYALVVMAKRISELFTTCYSRRSSDALLF